MIIVMLGAAQGVMQGKFVLGRFYDLISSQGYCSGLKPRCKDHSKSLVNGLLIHSIVDERGGGAIVNAGSCL